MPLPHYTIVQHSGFAYGGNDVFDKAVETRGVTAREAAKVVKAGGVVFPSYMMAEDYAEAENYQPDAHWLIPEVPGTFSDVKVDGLPVYVPAS